MIPIHPIHEDSCKPHYGRPVLVVMQDGTEHVGILSSASGGKLILNDFDDERHHDGHGESDKGSRKKTPKNKKIAKLAAAQGPLFTDGVVPYEPHSFNPWGSRIALELAAIAFLFLIFL